ncbi:MAG TPA: flagellar basal body L-ring protein FlgH [Rhizomicrobium sp.]|jgi:flagellar L-ring protein precursor FlgH|nr:flagellar basal body L-ring protein FlgH [Rhizomicrobium sp.]
MRISTLTAILLAASALSACSTVDRLKEIDGGPKVAPIVGPVAQTVTNMPMPPAPTEPRGNSSLWQTGARSFFHDPRASRVGDIITVNVSVADAAKFSNTTSRTRTNSDDANLTNFFGLEKALPSTMDPTSLVKMGSDTSNVGGGGIDRSESVNLTLAALVTQVLPNGNMVIGGHQQMKVNNELRDLEVTGIVRTEDITSANTVDLSQIAEARITYGGRGTVSDVQTPRLGSQLFDILMPW